MWTNVKGLRGVKMFKKRSKKGLEHIHFPSAKLSKNEVQARKTTGFKAHFVKNEVERVWGIWGLIGTTSSYTTWSRGFFSIKMVRHGDEFQRVSCAKHIMLSRVCEAGSNSDGGDIAYIYGINSISPIINKCQIKARYDHKQHYSDNR